MEHELQVSSNGEFSRDNIVFKGIRYIADYGLKAFIVKSIRTLGLQALNVRSESLSPRFRDSQIFKDNHFSNPELNREQFFGKMFMLLLTRELPLQ